LKRKGLLVLVPMMPELKGLHLVDTKHPHRFLTSGGSANQAGAGNRVQMPIWEQEHWDCVCTGMGKVQVSLAMMHMLAHTCYDTVLLVGSAGLYPSPIEKQIPLGTVCLVQKCWEYGLGHSTAHCPTFHYQNTAYSFWEWALQSAPFVSAEHKALGGAWVLSAEHTVSSPQMGKDMWTQLGVLPSSQNHCLLHAWESAGFARTAQFAQVPFVEIRVVSDYLYIEDIKQFSKQVTQCMKPVGSSITSVVQQL
jgi:hypothetical protein